ncbi:MAG: (deoxy)nucleoside triphosphate pyrophosphohydrolase [Mucilaginibacter sp.]
MAAALGAGPVFAAIGFRDDRYLYKLYFSSVIEVTCALILNSQGHVLAAQRSATMSLPLKWEFPGGKIENNESPEECLIREIKEELDVDIQIIKRLPINYHNYSSISIKLIPFICNTIMGKVTLKEHANFKWVNKNELLDLDWAEADIPIVKHFQTL